MSEMLEIIQFHFLHRTFQNDGIECGFRLGNEITLFSPFINRSSITEQTQSSKCWLFGFSFSFRKFVH